MTFTRIRDAAAEDHETFTGKANSVRFLFFAVSGDSGRAEQALCAEGGMTWEVNRIDTYTRLND